MRRFIGITGTPGTGKKSVAPLYAKLVGASSLSLNDFAFEMGLATGDKESLLVDTRALRRAVLSKTDELLVVYGHLLPDVLGRRDVQKVFVLRCDPRELKRRLSKRGYSGHKLSENVEAELIGVSLSAAVEAYGEESVMELDTTGRSAAGAAQALVRMSGRPPRHPLWIDWTLSYASAEKLRSLLSEGIR